MPTNSASELLSATFAVAVVLNLIAAVTELDGWSWTGTRMVVSAAFALALAWWVWGFVRSKRIGYDR